MPLKGDAYASFLPGTVTINGVAYTVPSADGSAGQHWETNGSGDVTWEDAGGGSGADTALSNLASVAINLSLTSDTDVTDDLGTGDIRWRDAYPSTVRSGLTAADTLLLQARDVDGSSWTTFLTLTSNDAPTADLASGVTIGGSAIAVSGGAFHDGFSDFVSGEHFLQSAITEVGTVTTGVWNGTDIAVADGGTGVSTLTDGGVLLGSGTGAITAMAVLADGEFIVGDGTTDPVAESGSTVRTSLGLGSAAIETWGASLDDLVTLGAPASDGQFIVATGAGAFAYESGATALTSIGGIGAATTDTLTNKAFDANGTGNSLSNVDVADLANGTDGELITWDAAGAPAAVAVGTATHVLTSNGVGVAPTFQAAGGGGGAVTREGGNSTEGTTTSTTAVDLLSVASLSIATSSPIYTVVSLRKTTGASGALDIGIKINSTECRSPVPVSAVQDAVGSGTLILHISEHDATYVRPGGFHCLFSCPGVSLTKTQQPLNVNDIPNASITDVIIRANVDDAAYTGGADGLQVYTHSTS